MENIIEMYLNYVNKFITVSKFAEWYGIEEQDAITIIEMGRKYNDMKAEYKTMKDTKDLFEHYELLPIEVQLVINHWSEADNTYENCESLVTDLNKLGYTCEYGLEAEPYNLRKLPDTNENKHHFPDVDWYLQD